MPAKVSGLGARSAGPEDPMQKFRAAQELLNERGGALPFATVVVAEIVRSRNRRGQCVLAMFGSNLEREKKVFLETGRASLRGFRVHDSGT